MVAADDAIADDCYVGSAVAPREPDYDDIGCDSSFECVEIAHDLHYDYMKVTIFDAVVFELPLVVE